MSGWRAAIVAAAVGGIILLVGWLVSRDGGGSNDPIGTTAASPAVEGTLLVCPLALKTACRDLAERLGVDFTSFTGAIPEGDAVVIAPAGDLPEGLTAGPVVARSPISLMVWRERASLLRAGCGTVDLDCLESAYGRTWDDLGGDIAWGDFKLGLADPTLSAPGLAAWALVAGDGVPTDLADSLRLRSQDDGHLMEEIAQFGDSRADAAVTTEAAIASQLVNVQGRGGRFEVFYPNPAPWVDYVAATTSTRAERLVQRLLEEEIQAMLGPLGLRPAAGDPPGLLEGLGIPGTPEAAVGDAEEAVLITAWNDLR